MKYTGVKKNTTQSSDINIFDSLHYLHCITVWCCFRAGMQPGDIVLEINGVKVNTSEEIYQAVRSSDVISMVVQRENKLVRLQMTPEFTE